MSQIDDHPIRPRKPTTSPDFTLRRVVRICVEMILCTLLIMAATASVCVHFVPEEYFSKVIMEVRLNPHYPDKYESWNHRTTAERIAEEFAWMQSQKVLYPVINRFELTKAYAAPGKALPSEEAYSRLTHSLQIREADNMDQFEGSKLYATPGKKPYFKDLSSRLKDFLHIRKAEYTSLVELGVYDRKPQLAADIANAIALQYEKERIREEDANTERGYQELRDEIEMQRRKVAKAAVQAEVIRDRYQIVDPDPTREDSPVIFADDSTADMDLHGEAVRDAQMSEYLDAKRNYVRERKLLETAELNYWATRMQCGLRNPPAFIWAKAEPSDRPARPDIPLYLAWEAGAGLVVGIARLALAAGKSRGTRTDGLSHGSGSV